MNGELSFSRTISTATALDLARLRARRAAQESAQAAPAAGDGSGAPDAVSRKSPAASSHKLDDAMLARVNDALLQRNSRAEFSFVEGTERMVLKLVDTTTNEVLRQVPSEDMIELARRLDDLRGLLVHKVA